MTAMSGHVATAPRSGPTPRPPLTKETIFRSALDLIDAEGLQALTMRRLAADLGVEAASLYHHVPNKQAVLDGAVGVMRAGIVIPDPMPTTWRDIMEVVFLAYLDLLVAHPHVLPMAARHLDTDPAEGLPYLVATGLSEDDAVAVWQSVIAFVFGFATFATGQIVGDADHLDAELATRMRHWDRDTAARAIRAVLAAYDITHLPEG